MTSSSSSRTLSWSYSRLIDFEQCRYRYKLKYHDKVPEEKSPAADRGTAIHQMAEDWVAGKGKQQPLELRHFETEFDTLRREYAEGRVSLEGEWGFARDWKIAPYKTAALRMKADSVHFNRKEDSAIVIDYKTGQRFGNEIKHGEQVMLYTLAVAIREPWVQSITGELWYLDKNEISTVTYTRKQAMGFVKMFDARSTRMFNAEEFPPNPNIYSCKWCPYGPAKGNQCPHGVTQSAMSISEYRQKFG